MGILFENKNGACAFSNDGEIRLILKNQNDDASSLNKLLFGDSCDIFIAKQDKKADSGLDMLVIANNPYAHVFFKKLWKMANSGRAKKYEEGAESLQLYWDCIVECLNKSNRIRNFIDAVYNHMPLINNRKREGKIIKKAMLSQPMAGKTEKEIVETREKAIAALNSKGYEIVNTLFTSEWYSRDKMLERGVVQIPLCFLAKSLENMSLCHAAYFCKGWENARGCKIEHDAAKAYGLDIIYEQ